VNFFPRIRTYMSTIRQRYRRTDRQTGRQTICFGNITLRQASRGKTRGRVRAGSSFKQVYTVNTHKWWRATRWFSAAAGCCRRRSIFSADRQTRLTINYQPASQSDSTQLKAGNFTYFLQTSVNNMCENCECEYSALVRRFLFGEPQ